MLVFLINPVIDLLNTNQIEFTWSWDTCAGQVDSNGYRVTGATVVNGKCTYNGMPTFPPTSNNAVFASGFTTLALTIGFSTSEINLLPLIPRNDGNFVAITHYYGFYSSYINFRKCTVTVNANKEI